MILLLVFYMILWFFYSGSEWYRP